MSDRRTLDPDEGSADEVNLGYERPAVGPSDSSDSAADAGSDSDSDRNGTGERLSAGEDPDMRVGNDIAPDRIIGAEEAGLGGGLDQAEEAQLGTTDEEEIAKRVRPRRGPKKN